MKKITLKSLFITGFASLIAGLVMVSVSLLSGGFNSLRHLNEPITVEKTYTSLKSIDLKMTTKYVEIVQSSDSSIHLTYRYWSDEKNTQVTLTDDDNKLILADKWQKFDDNIPFDGGLGTISKILNSVNGESGKVTLALPKNIELDYLAIHDAMGQASINHAHIKEINITNGYLYADHLTVDKGVLDNGNFKNSQLRQVKMSNYSSLYFDNTLLDQVDITYNGNFDLVNSTVKNSTISGEYAPMTMTNTTLDNSSLTFVSAPVTAENLTILGNVNLKTAEYLVDIDLSEASRNSISLDLASSGYGKLDLSSSFSDLTKTEQTATRILPDAKGKLTIVNEHADIELD